MLWNGVKGYLKTKPCNGNDGWITFKGFITLVYQNAIRLKSLDKFLTAICIIFLKLVKGDLAKPVTYNMLTIVEKFYCNLITGKSCVAPISYASIPRLELTAATVSVKVSRMQYEELNEEFSKNDWKYGRILLDRWYQVIQGIWCKFCASYQESFKCWPLALFKYSWESSKLYMNGTRF